jgi:hypothetical protein
MWIYADFHTVGTEQCSVPTPLITLNRRERKEVAAVAENITIEFLCVLFVFFAKFAVNIIFNLIYT